VRDDAVEDPRYREDNLRRVIGTGLRFLVKKIEEGMPKNHLVSTVQRMFLLNDEFDKCMIFLLRKMTKNFLERHSNVKVNRFSII